MANSSRKIIRGVRLKGKTYTDGMEDELAKVLPAEDVERLTKKGYIEGSWSGTAVPAKAAEPAKAPEPVKAPAKEK